MSIRWLAWILCALALAAADRRVVVPPGGPKPVGPYSPGIFAGDYLYVSGQGMRRPDNTVPQDNDGRIRQCLTNVRNIVEAAGLTMEHIAYSQVYLHNSVSVAEMERVWKEVFPRNPPARAVLGVHRMPTDTTVEINAVAVRDSSLKRPVRVQGWPELPYAPAIWAGDRLYFSGVLGRDARSGQLPQAAEAQVQAAMDGMKAVLGAAGIDFRHVVFVNPYLTGGVTTAQMNDVYAKHFEFGNTPARATIPVSFLPEGANVEFTGVAVRDLSQRKAVRPKNMPPSPTASPCVWAGDTLFCSAKSGFIPGPNGGIYADNVEDQVRQTMRNLLDGLEEAGLDFSNCVASNVYVDDIDEFSKMNGVYARYFSKSQPTRTTVAPLAPIPRMRTPSGHFPKLEEISVVAVK